MAKRAATSELNHNNWDVEEEVEERGAWKPAAAEALQGRVIKQARRKLTSNQGEDKPSVFAGFGGFGARSAPPPNVFSSVSFLPQSTPAADKENGMSATKPDEENNNEKEYLASLKVLNETVSSWIADHVRKNPYCLLTPIFQDYDKHLKGLEAKRKETTSSSKTEPAKTEPTQPKFAFSVKPAELPKTTEAPKPTFSFGLSTAAQTSTTTPSTPSSTFSFKPSASTTSTPAAPFSFGSLSKPSTTPTSSSTTSSESAPAPFSFGLTKPSFGTPSSTPFSFGLSAGKPPVKEEKKEEAEGEEGEDDEDAPPKVEITPVKEDDAFYSIKCKLFYKKDNSYAEKGVGTLHLKKTKEDKTQLVIRAENTIGTILLNILLNPQLTTQRVGKNNVMLVCIPNPPIDPKVAPVPTPMLLRVKSDVEADELLAKLDEAKK